MRYPALELVVELLVGLAVSAVGVPIPECLDHLVVRSCLYKSKNRVKLHLQFNSVLRMVY
jgi:hypothetical protein